MNSENWPSQSPPTFAKVGETSLLVTTRVRIFLDTVEQHGCTEYDTEAGYLVRYVWEERDGRRLLKAVGSEAVTERVTGLVEVVWKEPAA